MKKLLLCLAFAALGLVESPAAEAQLRLDRGSLGQGSSQFSRRSSHSQAYVLSPGRDHGNVLSATPIWRRSLPVEFGSSTARSAHAATTPHQGRGQLGHTLLGQVVNRNVVTGSGNGSGNTIVANNGSIHTGGVNLNIIKNSGNGEGNTVVANNGANPGGVNINIIKDSGNGTGNTVVAGNQGGGGGGGLNINVIKNSGNGSDNTIVTNNGGGGGGGVNINIIKDSGNGTGNTVVASNGG